MTTSPPDPRLLTDLRAAADRLIAGTPLRSGGKLTIVDLAAEAAIKRWILTHKHPELREQYQAEFKNLGQVSAPVQAALSKAADLEEGLAQLRAGKRELKDRVEAYAVLIRDLTERLDAVQRERDDALGELDRIRSGVVVLAERRRGTQRDA
ncbi:hypothetical protein AB0L53_30085 [Nonomuraea sp. NPDC052129]|uniref:hypothetical protein n=1 Tax=Nonomuraea sp. NPDC052129 TaxID=3154651 RepID=UPI00344AA1EB